MGNVWNPWNTIIFGDLDQTNKNSPVLFLVARTKPPKIVSYYFRCLYNFWWLLREKMVKIINFGDQNIVAKNYLMFGGRD
jgi:hypothetical protein